MHSRQVVAALTLLATLACSRAAAAQAGEEAAPRSTTLRSSCVASLRDGLPGAGREGLVKIAHVGEALLGRLFQGLAQDGGESVRQRLFCCFRDENRRF